MIRRMKKSTVSIMLAIMVASTVSTSKPTFAADDDGWTEAITTEAAKGGLWEAWCEKWENIKNDWTQLSISPGRNESELNFAWYSNVNETEPKVKISKNEDMSNAIEFNGAQSKAVPGYLSNKVTLTGLEENTKYYYTYGTNGNWSEVVEINTRDSSRFNFILVGDPQIGSSLNNTATGESTVQGQDKAARNDSFNWNNTINKALGLFPNTSFMLSAGDQVSIRNKKATIEEALVYTENEIEYAGYLSPTALKSLPMATAIGNHDAVSGNYSYHFNNPNASTLGSTVGGGNYYYSYGNTLFINLNTNNRNIAEHKQFIEEAVKSFEDATWKVVTVHQDIYGSGEHSNEPEIIELRHALVPIFEENNIDIALSGHDHTYSRSKILKGGLTDDDGKDAPVTDLDIQSGKVIDPDGILYVTANSASGSKYYDLVPKQQSYIDNRWQEDVPTFSNISVDEVSLSISTYRTDTMEKIDETYTIVKAIDKSNLNELISVAEEKVKDDYTLSTWGVFEEALNNAKIVSNQADATSDTISNSYADLNTSMNSLALKGNKEELNKIIEEARKIADNAVVGKENGNYSFEDKELFLAAIKEANNILSLDDVSQIDVNNAVDKLRESIKEFKGKVISEDKNGSGSNVNTGNSTSGNNNGNSNNPSKGNTLVNTGDSTALYTYGGIIISILALASLKFKKSNEKELEAN